jgi:hypothetical protein
MDDAGAAARADRLRQARAKAMAKKQQQQQSEQCPAGGAAPDAPAELARQHAQADEAMRALLEEEDASQSPTGKGKGKASRRAPPASSVKRQVKVSKALSFLLRHGATDAGLQMRTDGYVELAALLAQKSLRGTTVDEVVAIVATNDKQRFALWTDAATVFAAEPHANAIE